MFRDNKYFKFLNTNFREIILVLTIIIFIFFMLQVLRTIFSVNRKNDNNYNNVSTIYTPKETVASGKDITDEQYENHDGVINEFINYCNNGNIQKAYDMLTDECKKLKYPTLTEFDEDYCSLIFNKTKTYNIQSWINKNKYYTYKIRIIDDILSTGDYESSDNYEEYITVDTKDNSMKLNINNFIKTEQLNKKMETDELLINIESKDVYMQYEIYNLKIKNKTKKPILMDNLENKRKTIILKGDNDSTHGLSEDSLLTVSELLINPQVNKQISLRFSRYYSSDYEDKNIQFLNIIKDYDKYKETKELDDTEILKLEIKL